MSAEITDTFQNSVLQLVPTTEENAIDSTAIFGLAEFCDFKEDIATTLSQLHKEGKINRKKKEFSGGSKSQYLYWREDTSIKSYAEIIDHLKITPKPAEPAQAKPADASTNQAPKTVMVSLKPVTTYSLITPKGQIDHFTQIGEPWNDMLELRNPAGDVLIVGIVPDDFKSAFNKLFSGALEEILGFDKAKKYALIKCSPNLIDLF